MESPMSENRSELNALIDQVMVQMITKPAPTNGNPAFNNSIDLIWRTQPQIRFYGHPHKPPHAYVAHVFAELNTEKTDVISWYAYIDQVTLYTDNSYTVYKRLPEDRVGFYEPINDLPVWSSLKQRVAEVISLHFLRELEYARTKVRENKTRNNAIAAILENKA